MDILSRDWNASLKELSSAAGCSRQRVHQILKKEGITNNNRRITAPLKKTADTNGSFMEMRSVAFPTGISVASTRGGRVSELLVAADLTAKGWTVFFPFLRNARCDLIALSDDGSRALRIEVRSGSRVEGNVRYPKKPNDICDHYAVAISGEPIIYFPDI
jgi:hypothetical protein